MLHAAEFLTHVRMIADNDAMAVGLRVLMPGQPDLEAGVTASTGLFFARVLQWAGTVAGAVAGEPIVGAVGSGFDFSNAGSIQLKRS